MKHKFNKDKKVPVMSLTCLVHHLDFPPLGDVATSSFCILDLPCPTQWPLASCGCQHFEFGQCD